MKLYDSKNVVAIAIITIISGLSVLFYDSYAEQTKQTVPTCEHCIELEQAITQVLQTIRADVNDYYLDVLCETEEYCNLIDVLNKPYTIPDSSYHKMREVFPDLPAQQVNSTWPE